MTNLTPRGRTRRNQMLRDLTVTMDRHHRAKRARRRAGAASFAVILLGIIAVQVQQGKRTVPSIDLNGRHVVRDDDITPGLTIGPDIQIVTNVHGILDRYRAIPAIEVEYLDDDALLRALDEIDRPAGLIRRAGTVQLTRPVTDESLTVPSMDV